MNRFRPNLVIAGGGAVRGGFAFGDFDASGASASAW